MKKIITNTIVLIATSTMIAQNQKPNIILIMCDDMGYSDLGCYGGEIETPNIDKLAQNGIRFTQFKNTARSCPSRAALMTGCYPHKAEMGWMTAVDENRPGYRGQMSDKIPTIAEILNKNGYATYMTGKWHLTIDTSFDQPNGSYPTQRGFQKYYGCLSGGGSYYKPDPLYTNTSKIDSLPKDYYYTKAITDSTIKYIQQHPDNQPMFCYVAHYAPHLPLQAPQEEIKLRIDRYKQGFDKLREKRFDKLKKLGIINQNQQIPIFDIEFNNKRPKWEDLTKKQQEKWIHDMATYATMIEIVDQGIGKIIQTLKQKEIYQNTIIMFISDNGSTFESGYIKQIMADLSNTPFRSYKSYTYNGGISSPFIYSDPKLPQNSKGKISQQPAHIIDILPTCINLAKAKYPKKHNGYDTQHDGKNLTKNIYNNKNIDRTLYFEHQTSSAIIHQNWKLVRNNAKMPWELYNLKNDPFETNNVAEKQNKRVKSLEKKWNKWAEKQNVFPFEYRNWGERIKYYSEKLK